MVNVVVRPLIERARMISLAGTLPSSASVIPTSSNKLLALNAVGAVTIEIEADSGGDAAGIALASFADKVNDTAGGIAGRG